MLLESGRQTVLMAKKRLFERIILRSVRSILSDLFNPNKSDNIQGQAVRQVVSGAVSTLADLICFKLFLVLGLPVLLAALCSVVLAGTINFCITRRYVFGQVERQNKSLRIQFLFYIPTVLVSAGLTQLILVVFNVWLGFGPMLVRISAVPVVYVWTVLSGKYIVFTKKKPIL
jgi:putative flippase GtrA